jgi:hypothetical protein
MDIIIDFESRLKSLRFNSSPFKFLESFLHAIKFPNATIEKFNSQNSGLLLPNKLYQINQRLSVVYSLNHNLSEVLDNFIRKEKQSNIDRYIFLFSENSILFYSFTSKEFIVTKDSELYKYVELLLPLAGIPYPKVKLLNKDLSIAEILGELFNELVIQNKSKTNDIRDYILQLIFLAFGDNLADSKGIIKKYFDTLSIDDQIDLKLYNRHLIEYVSGRNKSINLPNFIGILPSYKAELFAITPDIHVNKKSLLLIRKLFQFDWSDVNSDTIGSLVYKFVENSNESIGLHYTATSNVLKLLNPLFLNSYYKQLASCNDNVDALIDLALNVCEIKIFDPTSGPGCFLNIAYKELNNLLNAIQQRISYLTNSNFSKFEINISNLYALVNGDFGAKLTRITIAISKCQQLGSISTTKDFENAYEFASIKNSNPLREDWFAFCPNHGSTFIVGSPTFKGSKKLTSEEKQDMIFSCADLDKLNNLDYSSAWLYKSAKYIVNSKSKSALVITNSLTQGEQVPALWPNIFKLGLKIFFAYTSFKWRNSITQNTAVTVVIIGLSDSQSCPTCHLYDNERTYNTNLIGPYLAIETSTFIERRKKPLIDWLPPMPKGNMPYDNGNLLLDRNEYSKLITTEPSLKKYVKKIVGSEEFIQSIPRYCLWIEDEKLEEALTFPQIEKRITLVREFRRNNSDKNVVKMALRAHQFREIRSTKIQSLVVPSVSSENRVYIPMGFIGPDTIVSNLAFVIYDCNPWIMGLLESKMHLIWIKTVCGKLETRIRYSSELGYNNFPIPRLNNDDLMALNSIVLKILKVREKYSEMSLGALYNIETMPGDLRIVHQEMDLLVDSFYSDEPFSSDLERISFLFKMYDEINKNQKNE